MLLKRPRVLPSRHLPPAQRLLLAASGAVLLLDDLPNAGVSYGAPVLSNQVGIGGAGSISCGIVSMLNFTNVRLRVREGVYVEDTDIGVALERVAYYGQRAAEED